MEKFIALTAVASFLIFAGTYALAVPSGYALGTTERQAREIGTMLAAMPLAPKQSRSIQTADRASSVRRVRAFCAIVRIVAATDAGSMPAPTGRG